MYALMVSLLANPAAVTRIDGRITRMFGLDSARTGGRSQTRTAGRVTRMTGRIGQNMQTIRFSQPRGIFTNANLFEHSFLAEHLQKPDSIIKLSNDLGELLRFVCYVVTFRYILDLRRSRSSIRLHCKIALSIALT